LIADVRNETNGHYNDQCEPEACSAHDFHGQVVLLRGQENDRVDQTERDVDTETGPSEEMIEPSPSSDLQCNLEGDHEHDASDGQDTEIEPTDRATIAVHHSIAQGFPRQEENNHRVEDTFKNERDELLDGELVTRVSNRSLNT
jgi:hypothetical protein